MKKHYIDNLKSFIIFLVLIFHVVATFSSNGTAMNYKAEGIEAFDSIGYMIYPWFMMLMFVLSGMTAHYSLMKRSKKEFISNRLRNLLIPFIIYQLTFGLATSLFSFKVNNIEASLSELPKKVIFFIRILNGIGPSWFLLQLFVTSLIFILAFKLFDLDKIREKSDKLEIVSLLLLLIPVYIAGQFGYIAFTYRIPLYILCFFLGYLIFYHEEILKKLSNHSIFLGVVSIVLGLVQMKKYWGQAYQMIVNEPLVMIFSWISILLFLGAFYKYFNYTNEKLTYFTESSCSIYIFHFLPLTIGAYLIDYFKISLVGRYIILFLFILIVSLVLDKLVKQSSILRKAFGI